MKRRETCHQGHLSRRSVLAGGAAAILTTAQCLGGPSVLAEPVQGPTGRKVKIGVVGNGGRGSWIARLFQQHGGFEIWALADYFPEVVDRCGEALGVPKNRRFSGLSGYRRVIESGVEAVVLQTPPYFFPIHARAAIEAGRHVYMAKPVAIDVPGCMTIARLGQEATQKRLVFHVDFQMPTDPVNQKVAEAVRSGLLGPLARLKTVGVSGGHADPPKEKTIASRLRGLIWDNDICLGGGFIVSFDIHAIDAALWVLGRRPVAAVGRSRLVRPEPHGGDSPDVSSVIFEYEDGLFHDHFSQHLPNRTPGELSASFYTYNAHAVINYWEKSWYEIRGQKRLEENIVNAYEAGAKRNIDTFYRCIMEGNVGNPTVARGVDACLTCILGREASARGERLTMEALLAENRAIQPDLTGLVE